MTKELFFQYTKIPKLKFMPSTSKILPNLSFVLQLIIYFNYKLKDEEGARLEIILSLYLKENTFPL